MSMTDTDTSRLSFWRVAEDDPKRIAVIDADGNKITFAEMLDKVQRLSAGMRILGVTHGDAFAVVLPNCIEFLICELAAFQSGLYFVPVNWHLTAKEVAHVLNDSEATILVSHERFAQEFIDPAKLAQERRFSVGAIPGFLPFDDLLAEAPQLPDQRQAGTRMSYTSGTTGLPKGIRRALPEGDPADVMAQSGLTMATGFGNQPGPGVCLTCGPLYHAGPSTMSLTLHVGYTQVLMDRWTPEESLRLIDKYHVTCSQMVPTMFHRLLNLPENIRSKYDISSLVSVMHTAAPCPREIKQQMMDWFGPVIYETYGGTEGAATIATPRRWLKKPGTVGKPIHGVQLKIVDSEGHELSAGEVGEIYILARKGQKTEYYKDPEKTRSIWKGEYFTIGDMGYVDEDGFLFISDRKKDMIISGGVNIFPAEIEAVLLTHPKVYDVAVIGIPDDEWGEQVKAIVQPAAGIDASGELQAELIEFSRNKIAHYKCPRTVDFRESLPRADNGKLYKRRIRDEYWSGHSQRV